MILLRALKSKLAISFQLFFYLIQKLNFLNLRLSFLLDYKQKITEKKFSVSSDSFILIILIINFCQLLLKINFDIDSFKINQENADELEFSIEPRVWNLAKKVKLLFLSLILMHEFSL